VLASVHVAQLTGQVVQVAAPTAEKEPVEQGAQAEVTPLEKN